MDDLRQRALVLAAALGVFACSNADSSVPSGGGSDGTSPSVKITKPHEGDSFAITPDSVDVDVDFDVKNFELVAFGQEGTDMGKGQVRLYVDGDLCNDPGEMGEPALPYNKIWPNSAGEKHVGMDYCFGGASALDNMGHVLKAQLWHGDTALTVPSATDQINFKTTYSAEGGTETAADGSLETGDSGVEVSD